MHIKKKARSSFRDKKCLLYCDRRLSELPYSIIQHYLYNFQKNIASSLTFLFSYCENLQYNRIIL